jgi:hypothetical protein
MACAIMRHADTAKINALRGEREDNMKTQTEREKVSMKAKGIMDRMQKKEKDAICATIVEQINAFKKLGKLSKDGKALTGLPSRNIGINKYLTDRYCNGEAEVAYKLLELLSLESKDFCVGYSRFGSLLYLPSDYAGAPGGGDFAALMAARK